MFHKFSWALQFAAGVTLFGISFYLQGDVLTAFLGEAILAFTLTAALEASKALTIVLYRVMKAQQLVNYPRSVRALVLSFRIALVLLSAACSVMYLAQKLDRPNLQSVRAEDLQAIEREHAATLDRLRDAHERDRLRTASAVEERHKGSVQALHDRFQPVLQSLEQALDREMDNGVRGAFIGPRYRELQRRLDAEKAAHASQLARLGEAAAEESERRLDTLAERYRSAVARAEQDFRSRRQQLMDQSYSGDSRVENPVVYSFLGVLHAVLGLRVESLAFVFFFSLFLSVIVELGIMVSFENLTLAQLPIFAAQHQVALTLGQKRASTEGELRGFEMEEALGRGKVSRRREGMERRMDQAVAEAFP